MGDDNLFLDQSSPNYFAARHTFRAACDKLGWTRQALPVAARSPGGEQLTIDVAWSPAPPAAPTLVLSSGLHGVEGHFGSAVQLALLSALGWQRMSATGVRIVLLHALNPFGYAWSRRFDDGNIDNNRNFLLPGEEFRGAPASYARLDSWLNPESPPGRFDTFYPQAAYFALALGMTPLKQAIAGGQFEYPRGLFFGGRGPSETQQILAVHLAHWLSGSPRVMHLDFHTGLGKFGTGKLLLDAPLTPTQRAMLNEHFGREAYEESDFSPTAYQVRGSFGCWCAATSGVPDYLYACAEFGTYAPLQVLAGLRAENRAHHWSPPDSPVAQRAKARLRELFFPSSSAWARQVIEKSLQWIEAAVGGLKS
jgi:hypothetical protein